MNNFFQGIFEDERTVDSIGVVTPKSKNEAIDIHGDDDQNVKDYQDPGISVTPLASRAPIRPRKYSSSQPPKVFKNPPKQRPPARRNPVKQPDHLPITWYQKFDPNHDHWQVVRLGTHGNVHNVIYVYSAFFDDRDHKLGSVPTIRINAIAKTRFKVRSWILRSCSCLF